MELQDGAPAPAPEAKAQPEPVPDHARVVVVPVANPHTAPELLALARALVRTDGGRVIALVVVRSDDEHDVDRVEALQATVDRIGSDDDGVSVELLSRPASGIARGILDTALDEGADMIMLGVQAPTPGDVAVGPIAESVLDAAHCDVLIYRRGLHGGGLEAISGITVGVDGSAASRVGARAALILGEGLGHPVRVLHIRHPGMTTGQADEAIERALADLPGSEGCERVQVNAVSPARGLRTNVGRSELAVVGFTNLVRVDGGRMSTTARAALDTLRGPVIAVSRPTRTEGAGAPLRRLAARLRPRMTDVEEENLVWQARLQATLTADFVVLCVLSALIASFGLLLDSAAVIIGAMLVAPLMSPLIAFGTALIDGDGTTLRRAATTVAIGTALVGTTALLVGLVVGTSEATPEMASRGSPTLVDAGVAVASGMVGAYASARKGVPAALAGVAIAAALVPPVCVFGLSLVVDRGLTTGSGLLFATNIACMAAASSLVLLWLGLEIQHPGSGHRRAYVGGTAASVVLVLLGLIVFGVIGPRADLEGVGELVTDLMPEVEVVQVDDQGPPGSVTVTVRSAGQVPAAALAEARRQVRTAHGLELRLAVQQLLGG